MSRPRLRASLRLNNDVTVAEFVQLAKLAESLGFDQLWVSNDLFLRSAPVLLTAAALATDRIGLGSSILNPYSIHPAELAMMASTLQEVSDGRFLLGLAAGAADFLGWAGIEQSAPLRRTAEAIHAVRALCGGRSPAEVAGTGAGWTPDAFMRTPTESTPIYLGAMSPRMLELVGATADGALPLLFPPESYATVRATIDGGAMAAGRQPSEIDVAACVWVSVHDDPDAARRPLARKLAYYAPSFSATVLARIGLEPGDLANLRRERNPARATALVSDDLMSLGIAGTPDDVTTRCRALVDAGADHVSFGPPLGPHPVDAVRMLGERVLPALRAGRTHAAPGHG